MQLQILWGFNTWGPALATRETVLTKIPRSHLHCLSLRCVAKLALRLFRTHIHLGLFIFVAFVTNSCFAESLIHPWISPLRLGFSKLFLGFLSMCSPQELIFVWFCSVVFCLVWGPQSMVLRQFLALCLGVTPRMESEALKEKHVLLCTISPASKSWF